jgi:hypothetical protein
MSRWPLTRRNWRSAASLPAAAQRRRMSPSRHRFHVAGGVSGDGDHRLDRVGGPQRAEECPVDTETTHGEHLFEALSDGAGRIRPPVFNFGGQRPGVGQALVGVGMRERCRQTLIDAGLFRPGNPLPAPEDGGSAPAGLPAPPTTEWFHPGPLHGPGSCRGSARTTRPVRSPSVLPARAMPVVAHNDNGSSRADSAISVNANCIPSCRRLTTSPESATAASHRLPSYPWRSLSFRDRLPPPDPAARQAPDGGPFSMSLCSRDWRWREAPSDLLRNDPRNAAHQR